MDCCLFPPPACITHCVCYGWCRENGNLSVCQESKGGLQQDVLFLWVGFRNNEQEGLGRTGCTKMITVGWVSLGSPSGNSQPLLQENQMAKGDSLDSMCWNCTDVVVRRVRNGKWKGQSTVILTKLKLRLGFFYYYYFHEVAKLSESLFTAVAVPYPE